MTSTAPSSSTRPAALIGWRLLAIFYDFWPVLALWMLVAVPFVVADAVVSGNTRHNIAAFSTVGWLLWATCWLVTGLYATVSWHRGGQTLGMRPWRLRLVSRDGATATWSKLWFRYAVGTVSLLLGGAGFWWAWFDPEKLTWHDRASRTHLIRLPKRRS